ncbi:MAG: T9SS type A sorting domain-containing protein [Ignavibacteria bacterium]|nr:T9SS type A sorting domain-containing protein [Ignavibacteria bacterium]
MTHRGIFLTILLGVLCTGLMFAGEDGIEVDATTSTHSLNIVSGVTSPITVPSPVSTEDVLYDNGPLITHPGGGFGGADASAVQTSLLMSVYGFGHQGSLGTWVADEFVVTDPSWTLDSLCFFAYQTGSSTTSTITAVKYQIWDGDPSIGGSSIVCADSVDLAGGLTTSWSGIYRTLDTDIATASTRPIMYNKVPVTCELFTGTYWVAWQTWGSLGSGPWAPPVTILGTTATGNAKQFTGGAWVDLLDTGSGAPQGLPFIVKGTAGTSGDPLAQYGVCYASTGQMGTDPGSLLTIDLVTGAGTVVGSSGLVGLPGLAINSSGVIYATETSNGDLYTINASTGEATFVGSTGLGFLDAIAFSADDVLYGIDVAFDLYTIDTGTATPTLVGNTGDVFTGMAFDPTDGTCYASVGGFAPINPDGIATIDITTGAATIIGTTGLGGSTPDLHFDQDGNLYGVKGGGGADADLIAIDKNTGAGTVVGTVGYASVSGLASRLEFEVVDPDLFWDDFDSYTAGMQLVSQNGTDWDTWSNAPGSAEDPFVSSTYAYSGPNSVVIAQNNDLIRRHGDRTTGTWGMSWQMYIPAGQAGYFNTMSDFDVSTYWAMECYFDAGGTGRLLTGNPQVDFTWTEDTWTLIEVVVDLDADSAQFLMDGTIIAGWKWTLGASGGTGPLQLAVNDFFGATALDEMYFDDYHFAADMIRSDIGPEAQMSLTHTPGSLNMGIFNDGSIGADNVGFIGPGITWNGVQGCFVGGPMFGTSAVGSVNGLIGSFSVFGDLVNVASDFASGFTSDANFDQIAWANLDDSGAAVPYGVDILQRSYSNTGEEVGFIRYGFVNSSGDNLSEFYAGIFLDWDVASNFATNSGGVDTERNLIYTFGTVSGEPYFGLVALDGNLGGRTTTATPPGTAQSGSFEWISTLSTVVDPNGDFRTWIGTGPMDILAGDTAWVTFAVVAGDDLAGVQANADGAAAKAKAVGWIVSTGVDGGVAEIPVEFDLVQNYPNPFNPTTTIQYSLKEQANVVLKVYDILGKEVRTLINEEQGAGVRQVVWDGKNNTGAQVASGMYIYRIQANDFVSTMKMLLMK